MGSDLVSRCTASFCLQPLQSGMFYPRVEMTRQRQELQEIPPGYIYAVGDPSPPSCQSAVYKQPIPAAEQRQILLLLQRLVLAVWSKLPVHWFSQLPGNANTTLHLQGHYRSLFRVKLSRNICSYIQILPTFVIVEDLRTLYTIHTFRMANFIRYAIIQTLPCL